MSPSAAAPSRASQIACSSTSASEWPARPLSCAISTPPITSRLPATSACTSMPCPILIALPSSFRQDRFRDLEVLRKSDLDVLAAAGDEARAQPHLLHRACFVGHRVLRFLQRLHQQAAAEHLRRLRQPELAAILGAGDALRTRLLFGHTLHRIG